MLKCSLVDNPIEFVQEVYGGRTMDRRIQRTHQVLHQALISLIVEKGYEVITVQDIIDRANVGRSTFYTHYVGKQDLLRAGLKHLKEHLFAHQQAAREVKGAPKEQGFAFSLALFEHVHSYRPVYHAMVGRQGGTIVMSELRALLAELVQNDLKTLSPKKLPSDLPRNAVTHFAVGALISVITWWLDERSKLSPAEANAIFRRLTLPAIFVQS
jgi:AcrR family transcriptional regulator